MMNHQPELLAPAGDWPSLVTAIANGADSVYFGVRGINMRHYAANFDPLEIKKVMAYVRQHGRKGYLALNTMLYQDELDKAGRILRQARAAEVDAVILWDPAVLGLARDLGLRVHISTLAGVANTGALAHYARLGAERVVLARECTLAQIGQIIRQARAAGIHCEIEAFVHGAMCVSISGRCFMSLSAFGTSANKGQCFQPCRHEYEIRSTTSAEPAYILGKDYLLSPRDLCTIDFIDDLIRAGIHAFKIEGRMRPPEYLQAVTAAYRQAIDAFFNDRLDDALKAVLKDRLRQVYHRGFSSGFYLGRPDTDRSAGLGQGMEKIFLGEVARYYSRIAVAEIHLQAAPLERGQELLFVGRRTPAQYAVCDQMEQDHRPVASAAKASRVGVKLPFRVRPRDKVFIWRRRATDSSA